MRFYIPDIFESWGGLVLYDPEKVPRIKFPARWVVMPAHLIRESGAQDAVLRVTYDPQRVEVCRSDMAEKMPDEWKLLKGIFEAKYRLYWKKPPP